MRNPFSGFFRARGQPGAQNSVSSAMQFYFGMGSAKKNVSPRTSIQVSTVYACVRVISETIASLPMTVYRTTGNGSERAYDHPLYRVLHDEPNTEMTSFVLRETMLSHLLLWGNAYLQIIRNGAGKVVSLYPLLPDSMEVDRDDNGNLYYDYKLRDGSSVRLDKSQVLHIPALGFDGIMGYSPIALEKNTISLGIAADEYGSRFFANGATPSGVLTHPNTVKDPKKLREQWMSAYGGSDNAGKVAVLEEGMRFESVSMPNSDAQFLETRKFQVDEICRIFRVPPHMVGDLEHATFSNIEHQSISFAVHTIRPWLVRIEQAMNRALFTEEEKKTLFVRVNMDGLMRGDYKSRMEGYAIARQNGWMSANDIREMEAMNPIPEEDGGNEYLCNGNMITIKQAVRNTQEDADGISKMVTKTEEEPKEPEEMKETEENTEEQGGAQTEEKPKRGRRGGKR